jgi:hypothetical protein
MHLAPNRGRGFTSEVAFKFSERRPTVMRKRPASQCGHVRVGSIAQVIGVVAIAASAVAFVTHFRALKRLIEISQI